MKGCTLRFDEPLAEKTSFRLGGPAALYAECRTAEGLLHARRHARDRDMPFYLLGRGTNLLIADAGVPGMVARLAGPCFSGVRFEGTTVSAGAAVSLARLLAAAARQGLGGLEGLAGVPGTVGGALRMNAGAAGMSIGDLVTEITVLDAGDSVRVIGPREAGFGYRTSALADMVILQASLALRKSDARSVGEKMCAARERRRRGQPRRAKSAGCIFRNPEGACAGALIDGCKLKGARVGGAYVSRRHANFIINDGSASARDVSSLIERIREVVFEERSVSLELEICVWP